MFSTAFYTFLYNLVFSSSRYSAFELFCYFLCDFEEKTQLDIGVIIPIILSSKKPGILSPEEA